MLARHFAAFAALLTLPAVAAPPAGPNPAHLRRLVAIGNDPVNPYVFVEAHRAGWNADIPENSLPGIARAIAIGADIIEIDVRKTADGKLVLMHDAKIDRTTDGAGKVEQLTLAQIRAVHLRRADGNVTALRVPTLDEALDAIRGRILVRLDVKCLEACIDDVYATVRRKRLMDQAVADKLSHRFFADRKPGAYLEVGGNAEDYTSADVPASIDFVWLKDFPVDAPPHEAARRVKPHARLFAEPYDDRRSGGRGDKRSTSAPDAGWGWLLDQGVSVMLTNQPEKLIAYLKQKGLRDERVRLRR